MDGQMLLGFVPARGGSIRVPRKNVRPLAGESLIARTIRAALAARYLDGIAFSSDCEACIAEAQAAGLFTDYRRPYSLATSEATTAECVIDYLQWSAKIGGPAYTHVVLLQPTSPFRATDDIDNAIAHWRTSGRPSLVSATPVAPMKTFLIYRGADGTLIRESVDSGRDPFVLDGSVYITPTTMLLDRGVFWDCNSDLFVNHYPRPYDIDEETDFRAAEALVAANLLRQEDQA